MIVADIMTREVKTLSPNTPLKEAARAMVAAGVSGMPVVDPNGKLLGILTEADFIGTHRKGPRSRRLLRVLFGDGEDDLAEAEVAAELMTTNPISVAPTTTVREAGRVLAEEGIKRLPVIDTEGTLVGIVSRADLLATFARSDELIQDDVIRAIQALPLPIDLEQLAISVEDGLVTLRGKVETSADAAVLAHVIEHLEGVTKLESRLEWEVELAYPEQRWPGFSQEGAK